MTLPGAEDDGFSAVLRAKSAACQTLLNAQLRVDENRLKKQENDNLADLLAIIAREEQRLPLIAAE